MPGKVRAASVLLARPIVCGRVDEAVCGNIKVAIFATVKEEGLLKIQAVWCRVVLPAV
jgi:hypothetical protein